MPSSASRGPGAHTSVGARTPGLFLIAARSSATTEPALKVVPATLQSSSSETITRPATSAETEAFSGIASLSAVLPDSTNVSLWKKSFARTSSEIVLPCPSRSTLGNTPTSLL